MTEGPTTWGASPAPLTPGRAAPTRPSGPIPSLCPKPLQGFGTGTARNTLVLLGLSSSIPLGTCVAHGGQSPGSGCQHLLLPGCLREATAASRPDPAAAAPEWEPDRSILSPSQSGVGTPAPVQGAELGPSRRAHMQPSDRGAGGLASAKPPEPLSTRLLMARGALRPWPPCPWPPPFTHHKVPATSSQPPAQPPRPAPQSQHPPASRAAGES